jgi:hypothetical protein
MDDLGIALGIFALICLCLPPKYDPAIRIKEWLEGWR